MTHQVSPMSTEVGKIKKVQFIGLELLATASSVRAISHFVVTETSIDALVLPSFGNTVLYVPH